MPKEECKLSSGCKHKERKPKKPHYIPRPFGKPYNYKCFQCPFTCMEKSHLYNHMKYSLCKNSLSLLIESDWPYKKGNLLPSEQLRMEQGIVGNRSSDQEREHVEQKGGDDLHLSFSDGQEMEMEKAAETRMETNSTANQSSEQPEESPKVGAKQEAELIMADVFSLEEQLLRARSVEVESKLRHYRLSKTRLLLSESLPCYPPTLPPGHLNCPDAPPLNLSLLGVGYPLMSDLFSYLNPSLSAAATSSNSAQVGSLPFLASKAQLTHTHTHSDRSVLPPRFYYPFLCEHTSAPDPSKAIKPTTFTPKLNLWKFPTLRPAGSTEAWSSPGSLSPETGPGTGERNQGRWGVEQGVKKAVASLDSHNAPAEKKTAASFPFNQATPISVDRLLLQSSLNSRTRLDEDYSDIRSSAHLSEASEEKDRGTDGETNEGIDGEIVCDLSSALQELQRAEREAALHPEHAHSHHMWAQKIRKIRLELSHIQQALQRTTQGPLDLSLKKEPVAMTTSPLGEKKEIKQHSAQRHYMGSETGEEEDEEEEIETEDEWKKRSLDVLIRMGQSEGVSIVTPGVAMVKSEPFMGDGEALWNSRTRKCEADSSVRVCSKTPNCPPSPINASSVQ
ncbi:proline-rich protein 35 [Clarias gariepinus]|uniref:proline-rich protein 35 n=1 Tax=Clarias gariepinus TaxID=13013 RepID=UPI00234D9E5D|nr:proline-rich protein 35 [Clarias gariepinus]